MDAHETEYFLALEEKVWQAQVTGDPEAEREVLPGDFLGVDTDGFADLDQHLAQLADGPLTAQYALSEARLLRLGEEAVLLSYRADARAPGAQTAQRYYISSLWQRREGRWWNTFSQDTPGAGSRDMPAADEGGRAPGRKAPPAP